MHFIFSEKEQNKCNTKELTNQEKQKFMKIEQEKTVELTNQLFEAFFDNRTKNKLKSQTTH